MSEFGLIRPFGIDDGELDGLSPQEIFVLGYELSRVDRAIEAGEPCKMMVHAANRDRIESHCKKHGASFSFTWMPGDQSEEWINLEIK